MAMPVLYYFNSRGRMESIQWLLAAAGVQFEENLVKTQEDMKKLIKNGSLMFQQVPMVEIDGMKLVQTRAILNYIAAKYNLYGKDIKERALIDIYSEGVADLNEIILHYPFLPPGDKDGSLTQIKEKSRNFPAFEKVLKSHGQDYLVGNRLSKADVEQMPLSLHTESIQASLLPSFLPSVRALKTRVSNLPTVKKFLQPGSQRKPFEDEKFVEELKKSFG
ncbi:glutathione S-transferase alpha-3-like isoform X1 [Urocitellus parryii]